MRSPPPIPVSLSNMKFGRHAIISRTHKNASRNHARNEQEVRHFWLESDNLPSITKPRLIAHCSIPNNYVWWLRGFDIAVERGEKMGFWKLRPALFRPPTQARSSGGACFLFFFFLSTGRGRKKCTPEYFECLQKMTHKHHHNVSWSHKHRKWHYSRKIDLFSDGLATERAACVSVKKVSLKKKRPRV